VKVKDLEIGMLLQPAGNEEIFYEFLSGDKMPYIKVMIQRKRSRWNVRPRKVKNKTPRQIMYIGTKKDLNIPHCDMSWANRFVLYNDHISAVDPSAWRRMKPA